MIFVLKFFLIELLVKQVDCECNFFSQQPILQSPKAQFEEQLSDDQILQKANFGYGIWMKYQPFRDIDDLRGQFIYSIEQRESQQKIVVVSVYFDDEKEVIQYQIFFSSQSKQQILYFSQNPDLYEGLWIMFFFYIDFNQKISNFGFQNPQALQQIQVVKEIPLFGQTIKHIQGGLYQYTNNEQTLVILDQFKGQLSYAFTLIQENIFEDINLCIKKFMMYMYCQEFYQVLTNWNQQMNGNNCVYQTIIELDDPKYVIHGWIILNLTNQSNLETLIFRITINNDYNDDLYLGDRVALLKYYQSNIPAENGFELSTYSYQFPVKKQHQTQNDDKIADYGDQYSELFIQ
ncbi:unnamed protein product [Paramecium octaurelia]|uniref:Transmembrane protein n=1 Tax=Paramecium octaurelia TaxID=43137 RepID=A0A8S1X1L2_PAROT|nr:unnamed protein product [Paramecium octaurelia]